MSPSIINILVGTWFVVQSNFPLWLKGDKTRPAFNYTLLSKKGKETLLDEVSYTKNGKTKTIRGIDHPDRKNANAFTWKGKGLLFIARSHWEVKLMNEQEGWAVIFFTKTIFTPEGIDIISRHPDLSDNVIAKIKLQMGNDSLLKKHISSLKKLRQSN